MRLPKHLENISRERVASAPYNFVPLPEKVVCAIDYPTRLPAHNSFANEGFPHSGYFEVSLTTMSPLYIRCTVTVEKFVNDDDQAKNSPDFFHTRETTRPVIPGSSLRGMLRSLLEIASYGKMQGVSKRKLFYGRQQYQNSPHDLVPNELRNQDEIDYAEALFGFVKTESQSASRIAVTDASLETGQSEIWLSDKAITPRILSTPKPSTIQHYLVQETTTIKRLTNWDSPVEKTVIRGFKRYWHQGLGKGMAIEKIRNAIVENDESLKGKGDSDEDTQHTLIKPLRHGISFRFRVYFDNLSDRELGALCWILQPPGDEAQNYCHHLGMGKPLGLGAIKLESRLIRTKRKSRYGGLFDQKGWLTGSDQEGENLADRPTLEKLTESFERHILTELKLDQQCQRLRELKRIGMLLKTMEWPGFPPAPTGDRHLGVRPNTRYMSIKTKFMRNENEFRNRPVLPTPAAFGKLSGEVEPDINLEVNTKVKSTMISGSLSAKSTIEKEAGEAESIRLAIKSLKLPSEVNKAEGIVLLIEELTNDEYRVDCARKLKDRLMQIKLKEAHKEKPWWKSLNTILGEQ